MTSVSAMTSGNKTPSCQLGMSLTLVALDQDKGLSSSNPQIKSCTKYPGFQSFGSLEALISYGGGFWDVSPAHPGEQWDVMLHPHPRADLGRDCHYPINVIGEGRKKKKKGLLREMARNESQVS